MAREQANRDNLSGSGFLTQASLAEFPHPRVHMEQAMESETIYYWKELSHNNTIWQSSKRNRVNRMTKVLADDFDNDQASSLVEFLTAMSNGQLVQHGKSIEVTGLSSRRVKFLVNKFLHVNHLSEYGVLDTAGTFEIVHIRPETKQAEEAQEREALKPTMPFWPPYNVHPVKPSDMIEWQGQPPTKLIRSKKK